LRRIQLSNAASSRWWWKNHRWRIRSASCADSRNVRKFTTAFRITDAAVLAAATLSQRYISDRFLPDKAIDLIDEAAARLRTEIDSKPQALDEVDRQVMQLEIERQALKKERDKASKERLENIEKNWQT